ncbi:MAG: leucine-rich repeat domain-containing protein [Paludibacteraceae bacterium]|nr:leucine-rich repeat domain-containing protein [Paludibacteraceae bacterium]
MAEEKIFTENDRPDYIEGEFVIPEGYTAIDEYAFFNCDSMTSIHIPDSVTSIGNYAFRLCSSLTSIHIPDSVTKIGDYAFGKCKSLTITNIPESINKIGRRPFEECESLEKVVWPESLKYDKDEVFYGDDFSRITFVSSIDAANAEGTNADAEDTSKSSVCSHLDGKEMTTHEEFLQKFVDFANFKSLKAKKPHNNYVDITDEKMKAAKCGINAKVTQEDVFVNFLFDKVEGLSIYNKIESKSKTDVVNSLSRFGEVIWVSKEGKHPYIQVRKPIDDFSEETEIFCWYKDVILNLHEWFSNI